MVPEFVRKKNKGTACVTLSITASYFLAFCGLYRYSIVIFPFFKILITLTTYHFVFYLSLFYGSRMIACIRDYLYSRRAAYTFRC